MPFVRINQLTGTVGKMSRVAFERWEGCQDGEISMHARAKNLLDNYDKAQTVVSLLL